MVSNSDKLNKIYDFLKNSRNPLIFFDTDSDGTMSFLQLLQVNSNLKGVPLPKDDKKQLELGEYIGPETDLVLFFDTPIIEKDLLKKCGDKQIVWLDHHEGNSLDLINEFNIYHFNPLINDSNDNRSTSYWAYKIAGTKKNLPLAVVGTVADFFLLDILIDCKKECEKEFDMLINLSEKEQRDLLEFLSSTPFNQNQERRRYWIQKLSFDTRLGELKLFFDVLYKLDDISLENCVKTISNCSIVDLLAELNAGKVEPFSQFREIKQKINSHITKAIKNNKNSSIVFYYHEDKMSLNRQIVEELIYRYSNVQIIFSAYSKPSSTMVSCSFRSKFLPIRGLLVEELEKVRGKGGGHDLAAGAFVEKKKFETFKENFMKRCQEELSSYEL